MAYYRAVCSFFACVGQYKIGELADIEPAHVAAYIETLQAAAAKPTAKQHLAAIHMLFHWLIVGQVLTFNPAHVVRGPRHVVKRDETPVLTVEEASDSGDPALVFTSRGHTGPGTHVLIVGISDYPHLIGGTDPRLDIAEGMRQIDAPAISARALAKWFLDDFDNPTQPLASLALLLSERSPAVFAHPKSQRSQPLPQGTADELCDAIGSWISRSSNERDQLIFFFSGHGVSSGESILLLRDFGRRRLNAFDGALNLDGFIEAMQTMLPEYQLFLIDACRVPTSIANRAMGRQRLGRPCLDPRDLGDRGGKPAKQSVHHASSSLSPAYGRVGGISLYTEALLQALKGGGAQAHTSWWVNTLGLQTALSDYTERIAASEAVEQVPQLVNSSQFRVNKPRNIEVPVYVTSQPRDALSKMLRIEARLGNAMQAFYDQRQHGICAEWTWVSRSGPPLREHRLVATFPQAAEYDDYDDVLLLSTPSTRFEIAVRPRRPGELT